MSSIIVEQFVHEGFIALERFVEILHLYVVKVSLLGRRGEGQRQSAPSLCLARDVDGHRRGGVGGERRNVGLGDVCDAAALFVYAEYGDEMACIGIEFATHHVVVREVAEAGMDVGLIGCPVDTHAVDDVDDLFRQLFQRIDGFQHFVGQRVGEPSYRVVRGLDVGRERRCTYVAMRE